MADGLGDGVALGSGENVGKGVKVSATGWKGVEVALAFGSTVTRLKDGEDAGRLLGANVQDSKRTKHKIMPKIREVQS